MDLKFRTLEVPVVMAKAISKFKAVSCAYIAEKNFIDALRIESF